jgi:hypothetical protein
MIKLADKVKYRMENIDIDSVLKDDSFVEKAKASEAEANTIKEKCNELLALFDNPLPYTASGSTPAQNSEASQMLERRAELIDKLTEYIKNIHDPFTSN